jgi:hypothetical protein
VILTGLRVALCVRCTELIKSKDYLGPLPMLPCAATRRECWICQATVVGVGDMLQRDPSKAVFCPSHASRAASRAMASRRVDPWDHAEPQQAPRASGVTLETRPHWFF